MKECEQHLQSQAAIIAKLTGKVESYEEKLGLMSERVTDSEKQMKSDAGSFDMKLVETQKYFEETLAEKEVEISKLKVAVQMSEAALVERDADMKQLINRQESEIQRLMSKSEVNMQDEMMKMMDQKVKDTTEVLESKTKVIRVLQGEIAEKERVMLEQTSEIRTVKEKYDMTVEQMRLMQETFVSLETQWKGEKEKMEIESKQTSEAVTQEVGVKQAQMAQLQAGLEQYQTAYAQTSAAYLQLQAQCEQLQAASLQNTATEEQITQLKAQLQEKSSKAEQLEESSQEAYSKADTKHIKYKAMATAKIKKLEKQLKELKEVGIFKIK